LLGSGITTSFVELILKTQFYKNQMKNTFNAFMIAAILQVTVFTFASGQQTAILKSLPNGGYKRALLGEQIGITDITIHYSRPDVRKEKGIFGANLFR
jgi:hypothetical protein